MTDRPDFDVGDLVVCVDDGPCRYTGKLPKTSRRGRAYRVVKMWPPEAMTHPIWAFDAEGDVISPTAPSRACYRFRKIDKASDDWAAEWEACKPKERVQ